MKNPNDHYNIYWWGIPQSRYANGQSSLPKHWAHVGLIYWFWLEGSKLARSYLYMLYAWRISCSSRILIAIQKRAMKAVGLHHLFLHS